MMFWRKKKQIKKYFCPLCNQWSEFLPAGFVTRPDARCPYCDSVERMRASFYIYQNLRLVGRVLHLAPENPIYRWLCSRADIDYTCADINPAAYPYAPDCEKQDGMKMSYPDGKFDFVIHNHVMEHVPDDKEFIVECLRVLKDDGKMIVCLPFDPKRRSLPTDLTLTPDQCTARFHQPDHVRLYGYDFMNRLADSRWNIRELKLDDIFTPEQIDVMRLRYMNFKLTDGYVLITKKEISSDGKYDLRN